MTLVPGCQLNPVYFKESLHSSLLKFQGAPQLQVFRYNSPFPSFNKRSLCPTQKRICSQFIDRQNPRKGSNFVPRNDGEVPRSQSDSGPSSSDSKWLDKWNRPRRQQISPKPPQMAVNYRNNGGGVVSNWGSRRAGSSDNGADYGGGGASTMDKIVEKLKRFGYMDDESEREEKSERRIEKGSVEDIFYVEEGILPNTRGGFSEDSPLGVAERPFGGDGEARFPWEKPAAIEEEAKYSVRKRSRTSMAELTLPEPELRRLRNLSVKTKQKVKIGGGGVTKAVVDTIRDKWKDSEIVRLKVEGASALNMRRMHEILERKTGGLVIWRSGTSLSMYRGISYNHPSEHFRKQAFKDTSLQNMQSTPTDISIQDQSKLDSDNTIHPVEETFKADTSENFDSESSMEVRYEDEIDKLLADLGPRYEDWPGGDPLPVDADMLPSSVPGFKPPFRLLPYGVRATISVKEATALRRIARTLPPHFALGRNRQLQGLATAMVKLWERSSIAKVALKRGVQVTTSERMAEDIKRLTGGMLLSRNKDFLVFYRGKNFLSPAVAETLLERERMAMNLQDEEEQARLRSSALVTHAVEVAQQPIAAGSLKETLNADARWGKKLDDTDKENALREAEMLRHADLVKKLEKKLTLAEKKLMKGQYALEKVEHFLNPSKREADPESISDEERFMYRKLGLRMKAFLLLGRRGVFDGTIENMHLHWKYRELVKIIVKVKTFEEVKRIALSLEAESGGVLVSVDKVSKGYAIVVFRGKDYQRPSMLRPKNLLTKRKALARSIELQRREALLKHIATMQRNVAKLRSEIDQVETMEGQVDAEFYNTLESAYPSEEEDSEEEEDDAYLTTYNSENEEEEEGGGETSSNFIQTLKSERNGGGRYKDEALETESKEEDEQSFTGDDSKDADDSSSLHFPWDDQDPEAAETRPSL